MELLMIIKLSSTICTPEELEIIKANKNQKTHTG